MKKNFYLKNRFLLFFLFVFLEIFCNKDLIQKQELFLNKISSYLSEKEDMKFVLEKKFSEFRESIKNLNEKDLNEINNIKKLSNLITDLLLLIEETSNEYNFEKDVLTYINSNEEEDYLNYLNLCEESFDEMKKIEDKRREDFLDYIEKSQNITLAAQTLTSILYELLGALEKEVKIGLLTKSVGKLSQNFKAKSLESFKKKISNLAQLINFSISNLQEIITNINVFDITNELNFSKKNDFLNENFNSLINIFAITKSIFDENVSLKSLSKNINKNKKFINKKLERIIKEKNIYKEKIDKTKAFVIFIQEFAKEKKDFFVPVLKVLYQKIYSKISNFKNLNSTGKFLSTVIDIKQILFFFTIICIYKHLSLKREDAPIKKIVEMRLLSSLYIEKFDENIKKALSLTKEEEENLNWFSSNATNIAEDLLYIYSNPLNFEKKIEDFYEKYDKKKIESIDKICEKISNSINPNAKIKYINQETNKEEEKNKKERADFLSAVSGTNKNEKYAAIYNAIYETIYSSHKREFISENDGIIRFINNSIYNFSLNKPNIFNKFLTKTGTTISGLLGVVGTMAKNCLMAGGFVPIENVYEDSFKGLKASLNGKINEIFREATAENAHSAAKGNNFNQFIAEIDRRNVGAALVDVGAKDQLKNIANISDGFASFLTSLLEVSGSFWAVFKFDESVKIFKVFQDFFSKFHNFMTDSESKNGDFSSKKENFSDYTLDSAVFDNLRQKGALTWFYDVIESIKNPYLPTNKNLSRSVLISGPSGSGKTFLTKAFAQSVLNIGGSVRFISIDPKDLFVKKDSKDGENQPDMIQSISYMIDSAVEMNDTFIIHLDEFHLFFSTESGGLNHSRIADFLKLFNDLNEKQKKNPGKGFYIIVSTNKANLVPVEFFQNPSRIGSVVYIDYPDINERKILIKSYLKKMGIPFNQINIDLISSSLEGKKISQGKLIKIIQHAISKSKIIKKLIDTEMIMSSIDQISKGIIYDINSLDSKTINNLCEYYSATATLGLCLDEKNSQIIFDSVTIYPVSKQVKPDHIDNMYKIAKDQEFLYGEAYYNEVDAKVKFSSLNKTLEEVLFFISGSTYCNLFEFPVSQSSSLNNFREAYSSAINYIAYTDSNNFYEKSAEFFYLDIHGSEEHKENPYSKALENINVKKKAKEFLKICSFKFKDFIEKSNKFKIIQKEINLILHKKKILRKDFLLENKIIKENLKELRDEFNLFFNSLKEEINKNFKN